MREILLINISAPARRPVMTELAAVLSSHGVDVLDIAQAVIHEQLKLGLLVQLREAVDAGIIRAHPARDGVDGRNSTCDADFVGALRRMGHCGGRWSMESSICSDLRTPISFALLVPEIRHPGEFPPTLRRSKFAFAPKPFLFLLRVLPQRAPQKAVLLTPAARLARHHCPGN